MLDPDIYKYIDEGLIILSLKILLFDFDRLLESLPERNREGVIHLIKQSIGYLDAYDDVCLLFDIFIKMGVKSRSEVSLLSDVLFKCWMSVSYSFEYEDQDDAYDRLMHQLDNMEQFEEKEALQSICKKSLVFRMEEREQLLKNKMEEANTMWIQLWEEEEKIKEEQEKKIVEGKDMMEAYSVKHYEDSDDHCSDEDNMVWIFNTDADNYYGVGGDDELSDDILFDDVDPKKNIERKKKSDNIQKEIEQEIEEGTVDEVSFYKKSQQRNMFKSNLLKVLKLAGRKLFKSAIEELNKLLEECDGDSLIIARINMLKSDYQLEMLKQNQKAFKDKALLEYFKKVSVFAWQYKQAKQTLTLPTIAKSDIWNLYNDMVILTDGIGSKDHLLNRAVRDQAKAVKILEVFLEEADTDRQDLYRIREELVLLSSGYEYLSFNLTKITDSCDLINQMIGDRHYILEEIQKRKERERKSELSISKRADSTSKLFGWSRDIWYAKRASIRGKEKIEKIEKIDQPSYDIRMHIVQEKMEKIKKSTEMIKKQMPKHKIITKLKSLL
ncbi:hypothetical protein CI610_03526 [invertebrate metagenome]|uniref:Uncharacterized protein n=1 Tax=invertebrate metagenome TaxID=1711999 RepID=A0A2H9T2Y2_9ZZZZ